MRTESWMLGAGGAIRTLRGTALGQGQWAQGNGVRNNGQRSTLEDMCEGDEGQGRVGGAMLCNGAEGVVWLYAAPATDCAAAEDQQRFSSRGSCS